MVLPAQMSGQFIRIGTDRFATSLYLILGIIFLIIILMPLGAGENGDIEFSRGKVNPRSAVEGTEFIFTVRITSQIPVEEPVEVVIERHPHIMKEVDPQDTNYSDGKDFEYRERFQEGSHVYFFRCGNYSTRAATFYVSHERLIQYHPDLLLSMSLYLFPLLYIIHLLKKGAEHTESLLGSLKEIENGIISMNERRKRKNEIEIDSREKEVVKDG